MRIKIISASVRTDRKSHRASLYFKKFIESKLGPEVEIIDLKHLRFPVFEERLAYLKSPSADVLEFAGKIKEADGIIIVTPEYNGGYPASLKNCVDLLYDEWYKKPVGIVTASNGGFGGMEVITSLQFSLWKMKAWTIPAMFPIPKVQEAFNEEGTASDAAGMDKRAKVFVDELVWCIEAKKRMG